MSTVEAPSPSESPRPSNQSDRGFLSAVSGIWRKLRGGPEHQVVGLLSAERIQTEGVAIIKEVGGIFNDIPEVSHARSSARSKLRTRELSNEDVSGDTVAIDAGFTVDDQRVILTVTEDSKGAPLSIGMKVQNLNAESQDPALRIKVETRKSGFHEPEISYEDNRPGGIPVNPNTEATIASIRKELAKLQAKLSPQSSVPQ